MTRFDRRPSDIERDTAEVLAVLARIYNTTHDLDALDLDRRTARLDLDPIDTYERTAL